MPLLNPKIDVVLVVDRETCVVQAAYLSESCGFDQPSELWIDLGSSDFWIYHQDEFYDATLRTRRNSNNMISPSTSKRLSLVGVVYGAIPFDNQAYLQVGRTRFEPTNQFLS